MFNWIKKTYDSINESLSKNLPIIVGALTVLSVSVFVGVVCTRKKLNDEAPTTDSDFNELVDAIQKIVPFAETDNIIDFLQEEIELENSYHTSK